LAPARLNAIASGIKRLICCRTAKICSPRLACNPGWHALDLGCGPIGNLGLLAELTGPGGSVLGLDVNADNVALASEIVRSEGLGTVRVQAGDARATGLASYRSTLFMPGCC
jgi:SAM-dependent methyltransferase